MCSQRVPAFSECRHVLRVVLLAIFNCYCDAASRFDDSRLYLRGSDGPVPLVVMDSVLPKKVLGTLVKISRESGNIPEQWIQLGSKPRNTWQEAVLKIAAADLTETAEVML
eukprot:TRINITY_DN21358_c0_g1_i1.p1 TRINITY_DN21358_c0_g1~~TRINITY_DN21358_c0_g1_i1.p1  ORF type:complete len:111 (+),score=14.95 TRINITY_DN21358_c0_g1_i1:115-447(+)